MANKLYSDLTSGYFVEGRGKEGYMKKSKGWDNDTGGTTPNKHWSEGKETDIGLDSHNWFQGKKSKVGVRYKENFRRE